MCCRLAVGGLRPGPRARALVHEIAPWKIVDLRRLVTMSGRLLITWLALVLLVLAVGGWLVQALRWPSRALVPSAR